MDHNPGDSNASVCAPDETDYTYSSTGRPIRRKRSEDAIADSAMGADVSLNKQQIVNSISRRKSLRPRVLSNKANSANWITGMGGFRGPCPKGRSRRHILKKNPLKLAPAPPPVHMCTRVFHKGIWFQMGDIVSLVDVEGGVYYAQIRCLFMDNFDGKCCVLTWLSPTSETKSIEFDPKTYIIAMEEDVPRHIDCCDFVCRCPADYFRPLASPFDVYQHQRNFDV